MYLTWYVQIPDANVSTQAFNFTLTNQLNSRNDYITHFLVSLKDVRMNPLWWVAKYNLAQDATSFDITNNNTSQGYLFTWNYMRDYSGFMSATTLGYNSWSLPTSRKNITNAPEGSDVTWHVPTMNEYLSICPASEYNGDKSLFSSSFASAYDYTSGNLPTSSDIRDESTCIFGFNETTRNGLIPQSIWGPDMSSSANLRYAIRYLGTDYCSAWKYQYISNGTLTRLEITSKLIENIDVDDYSGMKEVFADMIGNDATFWNYDSEKRIFYACGYGDANGNNVAAPGPNQGSNYGSYMSATAEGGTSSSCCEHFVFYGNYIKVQSQSGIDGKTRGMSVRLFRDE